jgi:hypothetical protein
VIGTSAFTGSSAVELSAPSKPNVPASKIEQMVFISLFPRKARRKSGTIVRQPTWSSLNLTSTYLLNQDDEADRLCFIIFRSQNSWKIVSNLFDWNPNADCNHDAPVLMERGDDRHGWSRRSAGPGSPQSCRVLFYSSARLQYPSFF